MTDELELDIGSASTVGKGDLIVILQNGELKAAPVSTLPTVADMSIKDFIGPKGKDGRDGVDGKNGKDGRNGVDGKPGKDGSNGSNGKDGRDGIDGKSGKDGKPGLNGKDGKAGKDGRDGRDGKDGDFGGSLAPMIQIDGAFDLAFFFQGVTSNNEVLDYEFTKNVKLPQNLWGSRASARTAATGSTTFTIKKNDVSIGTIVFPPAATTPSITFTAMQTFQAGDIITIAAPTSADATLSDIRITISGTRI